MLLLRDIVSCLTKSVQLGHDVHPSVWGLRAKNSRDPLCLSSIPQNPHAHSHYLSLLVYTV